MSSPSIDLDPIAEAIRFALNGPSDVIVSPVVEAIAKERFRRAARAAVDAMPILGHAVIDGGHLTDWTLETDPEGAAGVLHPGPGQTVVALAPATLPQWRPV